MITAQLLLSRIVSRLVNLDDAAIDAVHMSSEPHTSAEDKWAAVLTIPTTDITTVSGVPVTPPEMYIITVARYQPE